MNIDTILYIAVFIIWLLDAFKPQVAPALNINLFSLGWALLVLTLLV